MHVKEVFEKVNYGSNNLLALADESFNADERFNKDLRVEYAKIISFKLHTSEY